MSTSVVVRHLGFDRKSFSTNVLQRPASQIWSQSANIRLSYWCFSGSQWASCSQSWMDRRAAYTAEALLLPTCVVDFRCFALFWNDGDSVRISAKNWTKFCTFTPPHPCKKLEKRWTRGLSEFLKLGLGPILWNILDREVLDRRIICPIYLGILCGPFCWVDLRVAGWAVRNLGTTHRRSRKNVLDFRLVEFIAP